jgi:hypothetical protein
MMPTVKSIIPLELAPTLFKSANAFEAAEEESRYF